MVYVYVLTFSGSSKQAFDDLIRSHHVPVNWPPHPPEKREEETILALLKAFSTNLQKMGLFGTKSASFSFFSATLQLLEKVEPF